MTSCPFCGVAAPTPKARPEPKVCETCARKFAPSFDACPYCAAEARAKSKGEEPAVATAADDDEGAWRAYAVLGAAFLLPVLLALFAWQHWVLVGSRLFRYASALGIPLGIAALYAVSRSSAVEAASILQPFWRFRLQETGFYARAAPALLPVFVASIPCTCLVYALMVFACAAGSSVTLACTSDPGSDPVQLECVGEGRRMRGVISRSKLVDGRIPGGFTVTARTALGAFALDLSTLAPLRSGGFGRSPSENPTSPSMRPGASMRGD